MKIKWLIYKIKKIRRIRGGGGGEWLLLPWKKGNKEQRIRRRQLLQTVNWWKQKRTLKGQYCAHENPPPSFSLWLLSILQTPFFFFLFPFPAKFSFSYSSGKSNDVKLAKNLKLKYLIVAWEKKYNNLEKRKSSKEKKSNEQKVQIFLKIWSPKLFLA